LTPPFGARGDYGWFLGGRDLLYMPPGVFFMAELLRSQGGAALLLPIDRVHELLRACEAAMQIEAGDVRAPALLMHPVTSPADF